MNFTPLHVYSGYSYLKSALKITDYVKEAKVLGYKNLSITDLGNFTVIPEFVRLCEKEGLKPIVGEDLIVEGNTLTFIVLNETGYRNLLVLSNESQLKPLTLELVKENSEGLVVILGSNNRVFEQIQDNAKQVAKIARGFDHFYIGLENNTGIYMTHVREFAFEFGYELIAFPFVKYLKSEDAIALAILDSINAGIPAPLTFKTKSGSDYLLNEKELNNLYSEQELNLTNEIVSQVNFKFISKRGEMLKFHNDLGLSSKDYLIKIANENLLKLGYTSKEYKDRLDLELDVITSMNYSDYFLIVKDFIDYARSHDIAVGPGRGSAVGSLVAHVLGITQADPIKYNLIFERFLNINRATLPDIDIDFDDVHREQVIEYAKEKYGKDNVVKILAVQKFGAKSALNYIGKVFKYDEYDIKRFSNLIKEDDEETKGKTTFAYLYKNNKEFKDLYNDDKYYKEIINLSVKLEGLPHQGSIHAAGVVINNDPLKNVLPLSVDSAGNVIEQFEKDYLEDQNFLKMDLLSIRNLTMIQDTLRRIKENHGIELNIDKIPHDEKLPIKFIATGRTMGLFQIESFGMRSAIKQIKPTEFEDIVALISLYRPGPMDNIPVYAAIKNGKQQATYLSKVTKEILSPTYGVIVYQEQVMQIANKMAGFSFGEADLLRRAISKKDSSKMASFEKKFIDGAIKNGYSQKEAEDVYKLIYKFGDYGFNKSHALGYAMVTCRMAYLKVHYPLEFYSTILTLSQSAYYSTVITEIKNSKFGIKNPDINKSTLEYIPLDQSILFPLTSVKGFGSSYALALLKERQQNGPFTDFFDFVARMVQYKVDEKQIMALINAGALDSIDPSRATLRANMTSALNYASMLGADKGQISVTLGLFDKPKLIRYEDDKLFDLQEEFKVLGLMLSSSLVELAKENYKDVKFDTINDISSKKSNVKLCVIIDKIRTIKTKKGDHMAFATVSDETGQVEITLFKDAYLPVKGKLAAGMLIVLEGYHSTKRDEFVVSSVTRLEK